MRAQKESTLGERMPPQAYPNSLFQRRSMKGGLAAPVCLAAALTGALLTASSPARAESDEDVPPPPTPSVVLPRIFVGGGGGYALVSATHPDIDTTHMRGALLNVHAGYALTQHWTLALEFTDFMAPLTRRDGGENFMTEETWLRPQADCNNCSPPPVGGRVVATGLHLSTLSPRVEFTPMGSDGLYFGASVGVAALNALEQIHSGRVGGSGMMRAGFRARPVKNLTLSLEGGVQAQTYSDASAAMYFGALQARFYL